MNHKETLITVAALGAIALVSLLAYRYETKPQVSTCSMCARPVHAATAFRVEAEGKSEVACCPRCGMHSMIMSAQKGRAWATDLSTGEQIRAESAYYNEGGDVQYCTMGEQEVQREPHGVSVREYDRCLPTLVAFKTRTEAEDYLKRHGGKTLDYTQALASVREE